MFYAKSFSQPDLSGALFANFVMGKALANWQKSGNTNKVKAKLLLKIAHEVERK